MNKFIKAKEILETKLKIGNTWQCPTVEEVHNLISEGCRETEANARLVQTHSEMLELLENMAIDINRVMGPDIYDGYYPYILDVIAKAKGEHQ